MRRMVVMQKCADAWTNADRPATGFLAAAPLVAQAVQRVVTGRVRQRRALRAGDVAEGKLIDALLHQRQFEFGGEAVGREGYGGGRQVSGGDFRRTVFGLIDVAPVLERVVRRPSLLRVLA